ncbi:MAG: LysM peptidoglycan-binding domain-containing protein [Gammaproteobacteria bacterium]|nr:LysM peptidoglycan-binding domain-containing protein [Gammaproteobacteria bacterium]
MASRKTENRDLAEPATSIFKSTRPTTDKSLRHKTEHPARDTQAFKTTDKLAVSSRASSRAIDEKPVSPTPAPIAEPAPVFEPIPALPPEVSRSAVSPEPPARRAVDYEDEDDSGMLWVVGIILLLLIIGGGATLYLSGVLSSPERTRYADTKPKLDVAPIEPREPPSQPVLSVTPAVPEPAPIEAPVSSGETMISEEAETISTEVEQPVTSEAPYSATIDATPGELTITLNGPDKDSEQPLLIQEPEAVTSEPVETEATTSPDELPQQALPEAPSPRAPKPTPPASKEIVHIVEQGDTLWDIAERYVKDPYRYPELARLSKIRNPDRIYPGDIVRIIQK